MGLVKVVTSYLYASECICGLNTLHMRNRGYRMRHSGAILRHKFGVRSHTCNQSIIGSAEPERGACEKIESTAICPIVDRPYLGARSPHPKSETESERDSPTAPAKKVNRDLSRWRQEVPSFSCFAA